MNETWTRVLNHVASTDEGREALRTWARRLVDAAWSACADSNEVPSTKWSDQIIDSVWKPEAPSRQIPTASEQVKQLLAEGNVLRARQVARSAKSDRQTLILQVKNFVPPLRPPPPAPPPPSAKGLEKYPPDGLYGGYSPCTCKDTCTTTCDGDCGCDACCAAYYDAIDWE